MASSSNSPPNNPNRNSRPAWWDKPWLHSPDDPDDPSTRSHHDNMTPMTDMTPNHNNYSATDNPSAAALNPTLAQFDDPDLPPIHRDPLPQDHRDPEYDASMDPDSFGEPEVYHGVMPIHPGFIDPAHPDFTPEANKAMRYLPENRLHMHPKLAMDPRVPDDPATYKLDAPARFTRRRTPEVQAEIQAKKVLDPRQRLFCFLYHTNGNKLSAAAEGAGYTPGGASNFLTNPLAIKELERLRRMEFERTKMGKEELITRMSALARGSIDDVLEIEEILIHPGDDDEPPGPGRPAKAAALTSRGPVTVQKARVKTNPDGSIAGAHLIRELSFDQYGNPRVKLHDSAKALELLAKQLGLFSDINLTLMGGFGVTHGGEIAARVSLTGLTDEELAALERAAERAISAPMEGARDDDVVVDIIEREELDRDMASDEDEEGGV